MLIRQRDRYSYHPDVHHYVIICPATTAFLLATTPLDATKKWTCSFFVEAESKSNRNCNSLLRNYSLTRSLTAACKTRLHIRPELSRWEWDAVTNGDKHSCRRSCQIPSIRITWPSFDRATLPLWVPLPPLLPVLFRWRIWRTSAVVVVVISLPRSWRRWWSANMGLNSARNPRGKWRTGLGILFRKRAAKWPPYQKRSAVSKMSNFERVLEVYDTEQADDKPYARWWEK